MARVFINKARINTVMKLIEVNLIKIGKLATPSALVLLGLGLVLKDQIVLGICSGIIGLLAYLLVWFWMKETAVAMAKVGLHKEKIKLKREQAYKERILSKTQERIEASRFEEERRKRKWEDRIGKRLWDSL